MFQRRLQIRNQIVGVFDTNRVSDQRFGNAAGGALLRRGLYVTCGCGRARNGFDGTQVGSKMSVAQARKEFLDRFETALQNKAEDAAKPAHLAARDTMIFVRLQARIKHGGDLGLRLQETSNRQRALVLMANAQMQRFHSPQQQVGGHGIETGSGNFSEVVNTAHQAAPAADHSAERICVSTEKLGRTVNDQVRTEFQRLLIDRCGKGVIDDHHGAAAMRGRRQASQIDNFIGRVGGALQIQDLAIPAIADSIAS